LALDAAIAAATRCAEDEAMGDELAGHEELIARAGAGDRPALAELFGRHRVRLEKMVRVRLHRALQGRIDPADVLQEVYLDLEQQLLRYPGPAALSPFLWLRFLTGQRLTRLHRHHLGAAMRAAGREVAIPHGDWTGADSASMAAQLVGRTTTASQAAVRKERARLVRDAIDALDQADREIISLRGFDGLSNSEATPCSGWLSPRRGPPLRGPARRPRPRGSQASGEGHEPGAHVIPGTVSLSELSASALAPDTENGIAIE
jgi:RNA polymerase sigma-70 factor (ECF subfamily)